MVFNAVNDYWILSLAKTCDWVRMMVVWADLKLSKNQFLNPRTVYSYCVEHALLLWWRTLPILSQAEEVTGQRGGELFALWQSPASKQSGSYRRAGLDTGVGHRKFPRWNFPTCTFLLHAIKSSTWKKNFFSVCVEDKRSFTDQVYDFSKPLILLVSDLNL